MPKVIGIIPARYKSKRFPGKPLALLGGIPLVVAVYRAVRESRTLSDLFVATDDDRIGAAVSDYGGKVIMTSKDHLTGSDRVAEAASAVPDAEIVVNIQGDEPFITGEIVNKVVFALEPPDALMSTACAPFTESSDIDDPDIVKVVLDIHGDAIYFSRSRIPYDRTAGLENSVIYRHIGIYGFKREFLMTFSRLERTPLERTEKLEQLRALEHGYRIRTVTVEWDFPGIDSSESIIRAETLLSRQEKSDG